MNKRNIAVFFGGCSPEYSVSLESAAAVIDGIDKTRNNVIPVGIAKEGEWFYYAGDTQAIREDRWQKGPCAPAVLSPGRKERRLLVFEGGGLKSMSLDGAFPVLHGKNGEDGTLQGLIELAGIPLIGCGTLASALCMDKDRAHKLAGAAGVAVPRALVLRRCDSLQAAERFAGEVGFPLYVKPVRAGSSYGITRVLEETELPAAIQGAFAYDKEVILEENIAGFEVGCALMGDEELIAGQVDEIELSQGFFDFAEKYTLKTAAIHVPARIPAETAERIKETAKRVYRALGCSGFARVDLFLTPEGEIVFNEVNTIPGFTAHSRFPGMMRAAGYSFEAVLETIIRQGVEGK